MKVYKVYADMNDKTKDKLVAVDRLRKRVYVSPDGGKFRGKDVADVEPEDVTSREDFDGYIRACDWVIHGGIFGLRKAWRDLLVNFLGRDARAAVAVWDIKI